MRKYNIAYIILAFIYVFINSQYQLNAANIKNTDKISISAENKFELIRSKKTYILSGDVIISRNDLKIKADEITAFYKNNPDDINLVKANGNISVTNKLVTMNSDKLIYDIEKEIIMLTGKNILVISKDGELTANNSIEYWQKKNIIVARGAVTLKDKINKITAGTITAILDNKTLNNEIGTISKVHMNDGLKLINDEITVVADNGVYSPATQIINACGGVKVIKQDNYLTSNCVKVNIKTGQTTATGELKAIINTNNKSLNK